MCIRDRGTDALLACGTTGEPSTMIKEEKRDLISYTVEKVQGRIPLIAGTGGNNTKEDVYKRQEQLHLLNRIGKEKVLQLLMQRLI